MAVRGVENPFKIFIGGIADNLDRNVLQQEFATHRIPEPDVGLYMVRVLVPLEIVSNTKKS